MLRHPSEVLRGHGYLLAVCIGLTTLTAGASERSAAYVVSISELAPAGTVVAVLSSLIESGDCSWEAVGLATDSPFELDATSGQVRLVGDSGIDFEHRPQYLLTFRGVFPQPVDPAAALFADDLRHFGLAAAALDAASPTARLVRLRIRLVDEPEPPQWHASSQQPLTFDLGNPLLEHSLSATDVDVDDRLQFAILSGNNDGWLACDPQSGRLSLQPQATIGALQGAQRRELNLELGATDSTGLMARNSVLVQLVDPGAWWSSDLSAIDMLEPTPLADALDLPISVEVATDLEPDSAIASLVTPPALETSTPSVVPPALAAASAPEALTPRSGIIGHDTVAHHPVAPSVVSPISPDSQTPPAVTAPLHVVPTGLLRSPVVGPRLRGTVAGNSQIVQLILNWGLLALAGLGLAAAVSIALRGRLRRHEGGEATPPEGQSEESIDAPEVERRQGDRRQTPRVAGRSGPPTRSLRAEMADLLAVSQHFTVTQQAQRERVFHGKQFRLAAVTTFAAGAIALGQGLLGLDRSFASEGWVVFSCVCVVTAAAVRALFSVGDAKRRMRTAGPLSAEFKLK